MKSAKALMMAAALPLALSFTAPVMAGTTTTAATTAPTVTAAPTTAARTGAKRRVHRRAVGVAKKAATVQAAVKKETKWVYTAKRMRPPKGKKWQGRWNDLGREGWELVAMSENMYIFKRPADFSLTASFDNSTWSNDAATAVTTATTTTVKKESKKAATKAVKDTSEKAATKAVNKAHY